MMDEERERKLIIYALSKLRRSCLHRRRVIALILQYMGRRRRLLEERRNFLRRGEIMMRQNLAAILSFLPTRDSGVRRFWVIPRPQHWFDMLLSRRDLDSEWPKHFRMSRQTFMKLVEIVGPQMTGQDSRFRSATPVEKKVELPLDPLESLGQPGVLKVI